MASHAWRSCSRACARKTTHGSGQRARRRIVHGFARASHRSRRRRRWARSADLVSSEPVVDGRPVSITRSRGGPDPNGSATVTDLAIGAPEAILALAEPSADDARGWADLLEANAATGERLVAVARRAPAGPWQIRALIGFADPMREGIREALETARGGGIEVIVVTGDHP